MSDQAAKPVTLYTHERDAGLYELWSEGVTPLIIDAFEICLWATPLVGSIVSSISPENNEMRVVAVTLILAMTFFMNWQLVSVGRYFHAKASICDSPIFRCGWIFICALAISRYTGGADVSCFTIVVFLPLVYTRVSTHLPSCISFYALIFFVLLLYRVALRSQHITDTQWNILPRQEGEWVENGYVRIGMYWFLLLSATSYHVVWSASHQSTSDNHRESPVMSYLFLHWRDSSIPLALFRTTIVFVCTVLFEIPAGTSIGHYEANLETLHIFILFVTMSTLTSWTHCQHLHPNSLRGILIATVTAAACGLSVGNVEQITTVIILSPVAIAFDWLYFTNTDKGENSKKETQKQKRG
jgi:hypothetical protein